MADHRFVEIHQTRSSTTVDKLWAALADTSLTPIAASNVCEKIVGKVLSNDLAFLDALLHLQNLVLTSTNKLKTSIFLRSISSLLHFHSRALYASVEFAVAASPSATVHPFIVISQQRPDLYDDLLQEADYLLNPPEDDDGDDGVSLLGSLDSFFDRILLSADVTRGTALLQRLSNPFPSMDQRLEIYYYISDVIKRYPTRRGTSLYLQLVDFLVGVFQIPDAPEEEVKAIATDIFFDLLCRSYDAATDGDWTLPFIQRLYRIIQSVDICSGQPLVSPNPHLFWASLSYLLMMVQTVRDQDVILSMMRDIIQAHSLGKMALVAILPLFQTWAEVVEEDALTKARKARALELLSFLNKAAENNEPSKSTILEEIQRDIPKYSIHGSMSHLINHVDQFLQDRHDWDTTMPLNKVSLAHSLLFTTPYVFNNEIAIRHKSMNRLSALSSTSTDMHSFKFPVFMLLLYLMRSHNAIAGDTFLYIYHTVFPSLVDLNDPVTTSKILQVILPMVQGSFQLQARDSTMAAIGFKVLVKMFERQPRVWHELKRVIANWILHRKSATRPEEKGAVQMELAVLTSMRDLCKHHSRQTAQDILPMAISLLQTCTNLNIASLAVIVQIMNACIRAELGEPRSLWTVAISYIAVFAKELPVHQVIVLWQGLCDFFSIVGDRDEVSEPYMEFKEAILDEFLEPLIASENDKVRSSALSALAHFQATDIQRILPEKAKQFTEQIIAAPDASHSAVLAKLISHELDHMRRGLFAEDTSSNKDINNSSSEQSQTRSTRNAIGRKEDEAGAMVVKEWEQARTPPGLRAGYAVALLHVSNAHLVDRKTTTGGDDTLTKAKWYRCMTTSLADIGLTDHLMVRISSLSGWVSVFGAALVSEEATFELRGTQILKDLLARLEKSTVPGMTCNILLALAGFAITTTRLSPSFGSSCASQILDVLFAKYILSPDQSAGSIPTTLLMSDEVQFAAYFSLGYIASCTISNEKMASRILGMLVDDVTAEDNGRKIGAVVDLVQLARGYAAGHFTAALATWPTKTQGIDTLSKSGISTLLDYCNRPCQQISEGRALGIMMGWASNIHANDMQDVTWFAKETLKLFVEEGSTRNINPGILLGAPWVVAYSSGNGQYNEGLSVLEQAKNIASRDSTLCGYCYHFSIPIAHVKRVSMIASTDQTEASAQYMALLHNTLDINNITSLFEIGSLLGVDYLNPAVDPEVLLDEARKYDGGARLDILDKLMSTAGLSTPGGTATVGDLRTARIAAIVCGKVNQAAVDMRNASAIDQNTAGTNQVLLNASTEPKSYGRLNNNTSYLRAVFDSLTDLVRYPSSHGIQCMQTLIQSLSETPGPLPPVNWFQLLADISSVSQSLRAKCIEFASVHASTSMSLTEYIVSELTVCDPGVQRILTGELGLGKILELSGLPNRNVSGTGFKRRGMDAVTKKSSISEMRCIEIFEPYAKRLSKLPHDIQLTLLSTLCDHLPPIHETAEDEHMEMLIRTIRDMTYFNFTMPLITKDTGRYLGSDIEKLVYKAIDCSVLESEKLGQLTKQDAYIYTTAMAEMCRLKRTTRATQWITDVMRQLIVQKVDDSRTWNQVTRAMLQTECKSNEERIAWMVRVLDILIVIASDRSLESKTEIIRQCVICALRYTAMALWWWSNLKTQATSAAEDEFNRLVTSWESGYMLADIVARGDAHHAGQQQMIKRILRATSLIDDDYTKHVLIAAIQQCPPESLNQQSSEQIIKLLSELNRQ